MSFGSCIIRETGCWQMIVQILLEWMLRQIKPFFNEENLFLQRFHNNCDHCVWKVKPRDGKWWIFLLLNLTVTATKCVVTSQLRV